METAQLWCKCLRIFFQIITALFPAFLIIFWLIPETVISFINYIPVIIPTDHYTVHNWHLDTKIMGALVSFIPGGFTIFMFYKLSRLFKLYEQGIFFTPANIRLIRKIAIAMLMKELIFPFYIALLYLILTKDFPQERHFLPIDVSNANFTVVVTGVLIIIISKVTLMAIKAREPETAKKLI